jgi:hypothetical protein
MIFSNNLLFHGRNSGELLRPKLQCVACPWEPVFRVTGLDFQANCQSNSSALFKKVESR